MTGYVRKFKEKNTTTTTMSLRVNDNNKQIFKIIIKYRKKLKS